MLTVALACVCVESFLGLDGRTWKGPSRRPGEPGALSFSTEPYFVLHCPFLSRLRNSPLVCSFCIFFWKSKHPIWPSWSFEYPSFLIARCHSVPWNQRIGSSPHLSWASQRPRLSKHYFLSPQPFSHFFFQIAPSHSDVVIGDIFKINHLGMAWCTLILPPLSPFPS